MASKSRGPGEHLTLKLRESTGPGGQDSCLAFVPLPGALGHERKEVNHAGPDPLKEGIGLLLQAEEEWA